MIWQGRFWKPHLISTDRLAVDWCMYEGDNHSPTIVKPVFVPDICFLIVVYFHVNSLWCSLDKYGDRSID
jgi:hypothetical protein